MVTIICTHLWSLVINSIQSNAHTTLTVIIKVLKARVRMNGNEHPDTLQAMSLLAKYSSNRKRGNSQRMWRRKNWGPAKDTCWILRDIYIYHESGILASLCFVLSRITRVAIWWYRTQLAYVGFSVHKLWIISRLDPRMTDGDFMENHQNRIVEAIYDFTAGSACISALADPRRCKLKHRGLNGIAGTLGKASKSVVLPIV